MENKYGFQFHYNFRGHGYLVLLKNNKPRKVWSARTGSIGKDGKLKNALKDQLWYLISKPVTAHKSEYDRMCILNVPGFAWKWRLWPIPCPRDHSYSARSRLLIHPDGGKGGTRGCLGLLGTNAMELYKFGLLMYRENPNLLLKVDVKRI